MAASASVDSSAASSIPVWSIAADRSASVKRTYLPRASKTPRLTLNPLPRLRSFTISRNSGQVSVASCTTLEVPSWDPSSTTITSPAMDLAVKYALMRSRERPIRWASLYAGTTTLRNGAESRERPGGAESSPISRKVDMLLVPGMDLKYDNHYAQRMET